MYYTGMQYYIQCLKLPGAHSENFLKVDDKQNIVLTSDKKRATAFAISTVKESVRCHELEFCLTSSLSDQPLKPPEYVMDVGVSSFTVRRSFDPIMRLNPNYQQTRLLLKKGSDYRIPCSTNEWIKGTEACYIQCVHPQVTQFLCANEHSRKVQITGSASAVMAKNQISMLFQVQPVVQQPAQLNYKVSLFLKYPVQKYSLSVYFVIIELLVDILVNNPTVAGGYACGS